MTCKYCPIVEECKYKKEEKRESLIKRFLDYIFKSDTYYDCERLKEYMILERKSLRELSRGGF